MTPEYYTRLDVINGAQVEIPVCQDCGKTRYCGDWPQCPHIPGNFGEEPLEPYIDHNLCTEPVEITTRGERRAIMARQGMDYRPKRFDLVSGRKTYVDLGAKR
jgi:hypothetical protein